jgi:hypothetical protein
MRLACGDNVLAQVSKTGMRFRPYKVAHQESVETALESAPKVSREAARGYSGSNIYVDEAECNRSS